MLQSQYRKFTILLVTAIFNSEVVRANDLPNMIVNAYKYETTLIETPVSMRVLTEDNIYHERLYGFQSIASSTANVMAIDDDLARMSSFRIRGIGINEFQANFEGPITVNINQVPLTKPFMNLG